MHTTKVLGRLNNLPAESSQAGGHLPFLGTLKSSQKAAQGKPQTEDEEDKTLKEIESTMTSDEAKNLIKKSVLETDANKIDKQSSDTLNQLWRLQGDNVQVVTDYRNLRDNTNKALTRMQTETAITGEDKWIQSIEKQLTMMRILILRNKLRTQYEHPAYSPYDVNNSNDILIGLHQILQATDSLDAKRVYYIRKVAFLGMSFLFQYSISTHEALEMIIRGKETKYAGLAYRFFKYTQVRNSDTEAGQLIWSDATRVLRNRPDIIALYEEVETPSSQATSLTLSNCTYTPSFLIHSNLQKEVELGEIVF
ncbi:hypothetical protein PCANC_20932 [Puccinia coronata f. sp. avenae]|uniref:Uncharacterized protein n=1 Tax=Puccinia coronata f. sp. avenae TaxID=200324 RepID=A0A2N5SIE4_9BASI|nr:hypothetical protein PCANC_20932 [Puccinia coronata f. sp. avenae]PLW48217.1 hypothetical protein PCASD_03262 [Puccinia coronata f. sp. avenae]